jgi:antitoxin HigA-1
MDMFNPPHPGEFITETYMTPFAISCRILAEKLAISPSTLNRVLTARSGISPAMALRLAKTLGRSPESWLAMQAAYDLWVARQTIGLDAVSKMEFSVP